MASSYSEPAKYLNWQIEDDKLLLFTTSYINTSDIIRDVYSPIDEDLDDGLLIYFEGSVPKIDIRQKNVENVVPDISSRIHGALIDYVLSKLYLSKQNKNEADIISANQHYMAWRRRISSTNGGKPKHDGARVTIPDRRTSLR